ncbi:YdaU family protein [Ensifer sp. LC163]|uniref:YdaU family protein n=1 Tax=Ensifer sp. LC163 TaxID=1120652 RepID=UPI000813ADE2|nr:YdaU family protein [Ensifer sp. LC163]OCP36749.1 hypothetical protein BC360_05180 [Ensifer sp. LC163]
MSKMPWIRFFPSDWLAGTRGMSAVETGIYITLISTMYERGEPIPEDHARLARLCGASNSAFKKALETLVDEGKINRVDGGLWNDRVEKEQVYLSEKSEVGSKAARARWGKKGNENDVGNDADALRVHSEGNANQKPDARIEKEEPVGSSKKRGSRLSADFKPDLEFAASIGVDHSRALIEFDKFRDYWTAKAGKDAVKLDWPATWRNWIRNARTSGPSSRSPPSFSSAAKPGQTREEYLAAERRRSERSFQ